MDLSSTFTCQGWTIRYRLLEPDNSPGPKPTHTTAVVFIHGTPWSSDVFQPIAKALLARGGYNVLLYDLPGYGRSQEIQSIPSATSETRKFVGDTSVKAQAAILADLLKHLQLDGKDGNPTPAVVAHDIAGAIALRTHLIHQCDFASLMLMDTNAVLPWGDGFYKLARSEPDVFLKLPLGIYEAVVRAVIQSACFNPKRLLSGWEDTLARPWNSSDGDTEPAAEKKRRSFIRQIAQANDADVAEMLDADMYADVRCDVKILWGQEDRWIPREKMESLVSKIGHRVREFVAIPEAGHLIMIDQPERIALELLSWLSKDQ
jgi:pimeloyl-ACP methyl ester carboxylesterase